MHRKPRNWRPLVALLLLFLLVVVVFVTSRSSRNPGLADQFGAPQAHPPAVVPTWPDLAALRRAEEASQERTSRKRLRHHLRVVRRRTALRRQQRRQAAQYGVTPAPSFTYHGGTSSQAEEAVAFAYAQLGCPYVYGATGPCSSGFDCSGLTMDAWAAAGVTIPRTSEEQWASLPAVPVSAIRPGDLLIFDGGGHVGIYVGGGYLIDAPQPGETVEKVAFSGWYQANFAGAVRP